MDERQNLLTRIEATDRELAKAKAVLDGIGLGAGASSWYSEDLLKLQRELRDRQDRLDDLGKDVKSCQDLKPSWEALAVLRGDCEPLFAESLAMALGPLVRGSGLDSGLGEIADALVRDLNRATLNSWSQNTLLAEAEYVGEMNRVIRLRFPVTSVWDLPLVAHEYGHLVGFELERQGKLDALLKASAENFRMTAWLREHWADTFATFALGPAFACTCLLTRLDPSGDPNRGFPSHPSDAMRAHAILSVLRTMSQAAGLIGSMTDIIGYLDQFWSSATQSTGRGAGPDASHRARIDGWLTVFLSLLGTRQLRDSRYAGWRNVGETRNRLFDPNSLEATEPDRTKEGIADVVNAAWLARIEQVPTDQDDRRLSERAIRACRSLALEPREDRRMR